MWPHAAMSARTSVRISSPAASVSPVSLRPVTTPISPWSRAILSKIHPQGPAPYFMLVEVSYCGFGRCSIEVFAEGKAFQPPASLVAR